MLEECSLLLPLAQAAPGRDGAKSWAPLPEHLTLVPPSGGPSSWQLRFLLAPRSGAQDRPDRGGATCSVTCLHSSGDDRAGPRPASSPGWAEVLVDGTPLSVWAQRGGALEAVALRGPPYFLAQALGPLVESLGRCGGV